MRSFIGDLFAQVGMTPERSAEMADYLVRSDLRCVFSHGTSAAPGYAREMREGRVNPVPDVRVVEDTTSATVVDGDGGLGYFPTHEAMQITIRKALATGTAAATTTNHFHFGAAGTWSRIALEHDCIGLALSSNRFAVNPENTVLGAVTHGPLSVAIPAGEQPAFVFDGGGIHVPYTEERFLESPAVFFKGLGLNAVVTILGGLLAGIFRRELVESQWTSNQGSFLAVFNVSHFMPIEEFKAEMDRYLDEVGTTKLLPGIEQALMPGGLEHAWTQENQRDGIPVSDDHRERLEEAAQEFGIDAPFGRFERFG
jgi:LDH2 family malate/lactate/ureidoglycolate dehydrogenase